MFIAGTLSLSKLSGFMVQCGEGGGCERVTNSSYSNVPGTQISIAYIGFLGYLALGVLAFIRTRKGVENARKTITLGYLIAAVGALESLWLQFESLFNLHALCYWCLASAFVMVLTVIGYGMLATSDISEPSTEPRERDKTDKWLLIALPLVLLFAVGAEYQSLSSQMHGSVAHISDEDISVLIPANANRFGNPDAPITIVEFADMCCPTCRAKTPEIHKFIEDHVGKVKLIYRHFPLMNAHPMGATCAMVGEYAAEKGKFWNFTLAAMALPQAPETHMEVMSVAAQVGFDVNDVEKRIQDPNDPVVDRVHRDLSLANRLGLAGTPTFYVLAPGIPAQVGNSNSIMQILSEPRYQKILNGK